MHQLKKAQTSTEFIIYSGIVLIFATTIFGFVSHQLLTQHRLDDTEIMKEIADNIANEIYLANIVEDGYFRTFTVPDRINGKLYSLEIKNKTIILLLENYEQVRKIDAHIVGNITKGNNNITNAGGNVNLNQ